MNHQAGQNNKRIICAMSGGVDSSVAALLLKEQGCDVIGVTMKLWECFKTPSRQMCCSPADTDDARRVCEGLGIPHHVVDMREAFKRHVVEYFVSEYSKGRTPNPCIKCNELMKFNLLRKEAERLFGTSLIATGHYARIREGAPLTPNPLPQGERGSLPADVVVAGVRGFKLLRGVDPSRDQSYFLWTLTQRKLAQTVFPVGGLTKQEVRGLASRAGLKTASKRESREVCFVPDNDYAGFIADYFPELAKPAGNFVDVNGKVLGRHEGAHAYTMGQRRRLGFGFGKRRYVVDINVAENKVVLGDNEDLMKKEMVVTNVNWIKNAGEGIYNVKIRYKHEGADAKVVPQGDGVYVEFLTPQRAITPGQAAVFYDGEEVIGGGWIE